MVRNVILTTHEFSGRLLLLGSRDLPHGEVVDSDDQVRSEELLELTLDLVSDSLPLLLGVGAGADAADGAARASAAGASDVAIRLLGRLGLSNRESYLGEKVIAVLISRAISGLLTRALVAMEPVESCNLKGNCSYPGAQCYINPRSLVHDRMCKVLPNLG